MKKTDKGVHIVMEYEKRNKRRPTDVSRSRDIRGFDILSFDKDDKIRTIEVKTTSKKSAIPDAYRSEFTPSLQLIATHLYVVTDIDGDPKLHILKRKDIKNSELRVLEHVRFPSKLQKKLKDFRVEL